MAVPGSRDILSCLSQFRFSIFHSSVQAAHFCFHYIFRRRAMAMSFRKEECPLPHKASPTSHLSLECAPTVSPSVSSACHGLGVSSPRFFLFFIAQATHRRVVPSCPCRCPLVEFFFELLLSPWSTLMPALLFPPGVSAGDPQVSTSPRLPRCQQQF